MLAGCRASVILEAGSAAGAPVSAWAHVRLFSPWRELIDPTAEKLLAPTDWVSPTRARSRPEAARSPTT